MKKIKYVVNHTGIYIKDNFKKRTSDKVTFSSLIALDSNMKLVKPFVKEREFFRPLTNGDNLKALSNKGSLYYNISDITYIAECSAILKGSSHLQPRPLNLNILQVYGEDLVLSDVTTKIPYDLRDMLTQYCMAYLEKKVIA